MTVLLLAQWWLVAALLHLGDVAGQLTAAPPTCPDKTFTFTCNVTGDINGITTWRMGGSSECVLVHRSPCPISICGPGNVFNAAGGTGFGPETNATSFTSTLSGTADTALNGTLVECFGPANNVNPGNRVGRRILKLKGPPPVPEIPTVNITDCVSFTVEWRETPGSSEVVDNFTFRITPHLDCIRDSMTTATCSYNQADWGKIYTYAVSALNCGNQSGNEVTGRIRLEGPTRLTMVAIPMYDSSTRRLLEIESHATATESPVNITDGIDNSPTHYMFSYGMGSPIPVSTGSTPQCTNSSCQHTFKATSHHVQQYTVTVAARNMIGMGTASAPVTVGYTNYFFDALVNISSIGVPEITCHFLNGPVSSASCEVNYGTNQNYTNLSNSTSADDVNTTAVTLQLTQLQPNTEYYYIVLAIGDSMRARIRGSFITDVNECTTGTHGCHSRATCRNTQGSYTCSCNTGYSGNGSSCTVPPPSASTITTAVSQSPMSIDLIWTQPVGEVVDSFEIVASYQGPCTGFNHTSTWFLYGTARQHTLTGLKEFSDYTVTMVAVNDAGRSEWSSKTVTTLANAPEGSPMDLTALATNPVSIIIQWGRVPCINRNSNITGYMVRYSTGGSSTVDVSVSGTGQSDRVYTATLLAPNTSYSIQVAAVTSTGVTGPFSATVTEKTLPPEGVVVLNDVAIPNHGFAVLDNIGEYHKSLLCLTDQPACCRPPYYNDPMQPARGNWYFPNGTRLPSTGKQWDFHRTRGRMMVLLHRRRSGATGIYRCDIPDQNEEQLNLYVGVYTTNTGDVEVSSVHFQLTSELNATTPTFNLTCISTGGPATTVIWTSNSMTVMDDSAHHIASQMLTDGETATYNHTLMVTGRLVGVYECNVSNNKPSSSSRMLAVVAADHPTGLTAERLQEDPGSFRVLWTPPAFSASLTGYRIYYSGANDSGSVDVDALATNVTIGDRITGVTYNITMLALSPHLPSAVIGPATVTPGTSNVRFLLNDIAYKNNSLLTLEDIGEGENALLCITDLTACCRPPYTGEMGLDMGNWFFPNGTRIYTPGEGTDWDFYRTRGEMVVLMQRKGGGEDGIYHCEIPDAINVAQTIYIGLYSASTGSPNVTSLKFNRQSSTLTCSSTGGPATTVTWRKDGFVITLNATHQQTKRLVDPVAGTYQTVLTIDPSVGQQHIEGTYNCTVENDRGESSQTVVVIGAGV